MLTWNQRNFIATTITRDGIKRYQNWLIFISQFFY